MNKSLLVMIILGFLATSGTTALAAEDALNTGEDSGYEIGSDTRSWLNMQREGAQASSQAQTLPGPVMDQVYQRYIKSFGHPIPDLYEEHAVGQQ